MCTSPYHAVGVRPGAVRSATWSVSWYTHGGIDIILGNSLAGGIVCKGISLPPPSPIVVNTPWFDDPCHQRAVSRMFLQLVQ